MSMVGSLRKVAAISRGRRRVDLSHPARSPLGSAVVNCVIYRDGVRRRPPAASRRPSPACASTATASSGSGCTSPPRRSSPASPTVRPAPARRRGRRPCPSAAQSWSGTATLFAVFKTVCYVEHEELTATSEVVTTGEIMVFARAGLRGHRPARRHGSLGLCARTSKPTRSSSPRARRRCCTPSPTTWSTTTCTSPTPPGGHRPGRDGRLRPQVRERRRRPYLPAQARTPGAQAGGGPARPPVQAAGHPADACRRPARYRRTSATSPIICIRGDRADRRLRRPARLDPPGPPRAGHGRAERGHAQDHGLGRDHRRTDDGLRRLRHELRPHARTALALRLSAGHRASSPPPASAVHRGFKRNGWL